MPSTIEESLRAAARQLAEAGIDSPRLDAELLLGHILRLSRTGLLNHARTPLDPAPAATFAALLTRRLALEPLQYLTGRQEFYGREFHVRPGALIPRPETEHLVEFILSLPRPLGRIADLGVGSGPLAITLALELAQPVLGLDRHPIPLAVTRHNAAALSAPVHLLQSDWLSALRPQSLDLVVSNPPYIAESDAAQVMPGVARHEPPTALWGGPDGLDHYRTIAAQAAQVLRPGGRIVLELGPQSVHQLFSTWHNHLILPDLAGHPRVFTATLAP